METKRASQEIKVDPNGLERTDTKGELGLEPSQKASITQSEIQDLDATEVFLRENHISNEFLQELLQDEAAQKRLVRKVDLVLLPLLCGTYLLQYIDKQAMAYAAVFDLFTTTSVTQSQYSWFASIFYFAYLIGEYPWIFLAQKTRLGKVVSACVLCWGTVLMLTAVCKDFPGLAACRFFLGIFEAPITTCFMMTVSMW